MGEFLRKLFSSDFVAHGYCYLCKPEIVWLHATSDGMIALSYYLIFQESQAEEGLLNHDVADSAESPYHRGCKLAQTPREMKTGSE